jgi:hypothetical protein
MTGVSSVPSGASQSDQVTLAPSGLFVGKGGLGAASWQTLDKVG